MVHAAVQTLSVVFGQRPVVFDRCAIVASLTLAHTIIPFTLIYLFVLAVNNRIV